MFARRGRERLRNLTAEERELLAKYVDGGTRSQDLDIRDGVVQGLADAGILYRSASVSKFYTSFAHNIQPWAWDYLTENPALLRSD